MIISHIASFDWLRHNGPRLVTYSNIRNGKISIKQDA